VGGALKSYGIEDENGSCLYFVKIGKISTKSIEHLKTIKKLSSAQRRNSEKSLHDATQIIHSLRHLASDTFFLGIGRGGSICESIDGPLWLAQL